MGAWDGCLFFFLQDLARNTAYVWPGLLRVFLIKLVRKLSTRKGELHLGSFPPFFHLFILQIFLSIITRRFLEGHRISVKLSFSLKIGRIWIKDQKILINIFVLLHPINIVYITSAPMALVAAETPKKTQNNQSINSTLYRKSSYCAFLVGWKLNYLNIFSQTTSLIFEGQKLVWG